MTGSLDLLMDRVLRWRTWEAAHGRRHETSLGAISANGAHLVAVMVDDAKVASGESRELHAAVRACALEFAAYTDLLDQLQRTDDALHARAAGNRNAEAT